MWTKPRPTENANSVSSIVMNQSTPWPPNGSRLRCGRAHARRSARHRPRPSAAVAWRSGRGQVELHALLGRCATCERVIFTGFSFRGNRFHVVAIRVHHERGVVARRAKSGSAVVGPSSLEGGGVEGLDLGSAFGRKGRMLLHAVWVKPVNPEDGVIDAVPDAIGAFVLRKLHDPAKAKRA